MTFDGNSVVNGTALLKFWPVIILAGGIVGSAYVGNFRLDAQAQDILIQDGTIQTNQQAIIGLQRDLQQTNSALELEIARLQSQIALSDANEAAQLSAILLALQQLQSPTRSLTPGNGGP